MNRKPGSWGGPITLSEWVVIGGIVTLVVLIVREYVRA